MGFFEKKNKNPWNIRYFRVSKLHSYAKNTGVSQGEIMEGEASNLRADYVKFPSATHWVGVATHRASATHWVGSLCVNFILRKA